MRSMQSSAGNLHTALHALRASLEGAFAPDTAMPGLTGVSQSTGHCAAVAWILHELLGGKLVSARVEGQSHWFNRLEVDGDIVDVDLTGDQFRRPPVQIANQGTLYGGTVERSEIEVNAETRARAALLRTRAGVK